MSYPIKTKRHDEDESRVNRVLGKSYKRGGRASDDDGNTHISIVVNGQPKPPGLDPSALAAAMPRPPPPPPMPPPGMGGAGPMPPPALGAGAGPGPIAMRRGGRVKKAFGGQMTNETGGAGGGLGRLRKSKIAAKHTV